MSIALPSNLTVPDYLAWASTLPTKLRSELINGQVMRMPPETVAHNRLKTGIVEALRRALAASNLHGEVLIGGLAVPIDLHSAYLPDALLYIGSPIADDERTVPHASVVVEVLSPSTASFDRGGKLAGYFKLQSVVHYLVIDPDTKGLTHHRRLPDGSIGSSSHTQGILRLDPPGLDIDLANVLNP